MSPLSNSQKTSAIWIERMKKKVTGKGIKKIPSYLSEGKKKIPLPSPAPLNAKANKKKKEFLTLWGICGGDFCLTPFALTAKKKCMCGLIMLA